MKTHRKLKIGYILSITLFIVMGISSCKKESTITQTLDATQLVAGRVNGTWAHPTNIIVPENVPAEVFGTMRLVFTSDEEGNPISFIAKDCPIIFSGQEGTWSITGTQDSAIINLAGVTPVDELKAKVSGTSLTLTFHMGWENTETGEQGEGEFSVTLTRQK